MANAIPPEYELRVLTHLWEHGSLTARQLTDRIYPDGSHSSYTTVKKLLERLENKGYVQRSPGTPVQRYTATIDRQTLVSHEITDVVEKLCENSIAPLVNALVSGIHLTDSQRDELDQLITSYQAKNRKHSPREKKS